MKPNRFNLTVSAVLTLLPGNLYAADRVRNTTATSLINDAAWTTVAPGASDRAVWNSGSVGGATTLGGNASWQGILVGGATPTSGPLFTNSANPSAFTLTLGSAGIDLNNGGVTNRGITFESNTKLNLAANQTWKLGAGQSAANIVVSSVISGTGSLEITRDATASNIVQLSGANTFSGGFTLNSGAVVTIGVAAVTSAGNTTSSALGSYNGSQFLTINGGRINSGNFAFHARDAKIGGDFTFASTNRTEFGGSYDLQNGTRTMTLTRSATAANTVIQGGNVALRFSLDNNITSFSNGTLRIAADAGIADGNFVPVIANLGTAFTANAGLTLGSKVVYSAGTGSLNVASAVPSVTLEAGSYWNLAESATATPRNPQVNSLAGSGTVLSIGTATAGTAFTLFIRGNSGTVTDFSGSVINADTTTFSTSTVGIVGVTKEGNTTQIFSGTNAYTGPTIINGGTLQSTKSLALSTTASVAVNNAGSVLAVNYGGASDYTAAEVVTLLGKTTFGATSTALAFDTSNATAAVTYGNALTMAAGLRKVGAGTLILDQTSSYTGATMINGGTLLINGNISTSSLTTVNTGGTLGGSGTVGSTSVVGGTFAPGNSIDDINIIGNLTLGADSFSNFEISAEGNVSDLATISAQLNFGGTLNVSNIAGVLVVGQTFNLFDFASKSGSFSSINLPTLNSGLEWNQDNLYTTGEISVVPEPGAALLGGLGMLALLRRRR
jgi:fibronectin-binding autotransporter adhesin